MKAVSEPRICHCPILCWRCTKYLEATSSRQQETRKRSKMLRKPSVNHELASVPFCVVPYLVTISSQRQETKKKKQNAMKAVREPRIRHPPILCRYFTTYLAALSFPLKEIKKKAVKCCSPFFCPHIEFSRAVPIQHLTAWILVFFGIVRFLAEFELFARICPER